MVDIQTQIEKLEERAQLLKSQVRLWADDLEKIPRVAEEVR